MHTDNADHRTKSFYVYFFARRRNPRELIKIVGGVIPMTYYVSVDR